MSANWRKWEWGGIYDLSGCGALGAVLRTVEEDGCERSIIESSAMMHKFGRLISFISVDTWELARYENYLQWDKSATYCRAASAAFSDHFLRNKAGMNISE